MDKQNNKERHGRDDVQLPSSKPREEKDHHEEKSPVIEEYRKKPSADNTPETGPGGE